MVEAVQTGVELPPSLRSNASFYPAIKPSTEIVKNARYNDQQRSAPPFPIPYLVVRYTPSSA